MITEIDADGKSAAGRDGAQGIGPTCSAPYNHRNAGRLNCLFGAAPVLEH